MLRRSFLGSTLAVTSLLGQAGCKGGDDDARLVEDGFDFFPQSIASGDPRPEAVIVWTRVVDPDEPEADYDVELEIWVDDGEPSDVTRVVAVAEADFDHCVKLRVEGLEPATAYGYRFVYLAADGRALASRTGRTKTAPAPDADAPVRFAFLSCQDFNGRYYNALVHLAEQEIDFFVHLGDYVYETTGDSSFQDTAPGRVVTLSDTAGAILFEREDGTSYYAASSLDNYRELYRTYRSDAALQLLHETVPMIAVWDDHEFSDDCWGATATYYDGKQDEHDPDRRRRANRAWFEYMPVDYPDPEFVHALEGAAPPDDIRIWRDLRFGRHLHLVMTDLRSHRSDHLISEDAYPGAVVMDEATLEATGGVPEWATAYVDIEAYEDGRYAEVLRAAADAEGYPSDRITGPQSVAWINRVLEAAGSGEPPIDEMAADLPRGLAIHHMTKLGLWSDIGARYLVTAEPWRRFASWRWQESAGASEVAMGDAQQAWFLETMQGSDATWKVWGNEYCLTQLDIDLSALPLSETFQQRFSMTAEDWNGLPNRRAEIIDALAGVPNVVAITGDIHAFYASTPFATDTASNSIVEFVGGSVSSTAYQSLLERQVADDPLLSSTPGAADLAAAIQELLTVPGGPNPQLGFAATKEHGFAIAQVEAAAFTVEMFIAPEELVAAEQYADPAAIASQFVVERFKVDAGSRALFREIDGAWLRWDPATYAWV